MFKNKLLRALLAPFFMFADGDDLGGGGGGSEFDIAGAADAIGEDLFGGSDDDNNSDLAGGTSAGSGGGPAAGAAGPGAGEPGTPPAAGNPAGNPTPPANPAAGEPQKLTAPKTWRPEAVAAWDSLPPTVQAEVTKREQDMFSGIEGYKAHADLGKSFQQVTAPYQNLLASSNVDPVALTQNLMAAHAQLSLGSAEQKLATVQQIAKMYGVELQPADPDLAAFEDPSVRALRAELDSVKSKLSGQESRQAQIERVEHERIRASLTQEIDAFAADPANVYFTEVSADIVQLLNSNVAKDLKDAYERAVWLNPVTRAKEIDRQAAEKATKAQEEAQKKADEAAKATGANVRTRAKQASGTAALGSIDDTLKATLASINSRTK